MEFWRLLLTCCPEMCSPLDTPQVWQPPDSPARQSQNGRFFVTVWLLVLRRLVRVPEVTRRYACRRESDVAAVDKHRDTSLGACKYSGVVACPEKKTEAFIDSCTLRGGGWSFFWQQSGHDIPLEVRYDRTDGIRADGARSVMCAAFLSVGRFLWLKSHDNSTRSFLIGQYLLGRNYVP